MQSEDNFLLVTPKFMDGQFKNPELLICCYKILTDVIFKRPAMFYKLIFWLFVSMTVSGCSFNDRNEYRLHNGFFAYPDDELGLNLPVKVLEDLDRLPQSECEREDLRRLFIVADWQMKALHNQSYMFDSKSSGIKTLMSAFPSLADENIYRENRALVDSAGLSSALMKIRANCSKRTLAGPYDDW